jgi:hypothetical protein
VEDGFLRDRNSVENVDGLAFFGVIRRGGSFVYEQVVGGSTPSQRAISNKSPINDLVVDWAFCFCL